MKLRSAPDPANPVKTYIAALIGVCREVSRDPGNAKLLGTFVRLLPAAAWTILNLTGKSSPSTEESQ